MKYFDPIMDDALKRNDFEAVKALLVNGFDLTPIPGFGTYLDLAWSYRYHTEYDFEIVKLLIEFGESLNDPADPSIVMAAMQGNLEEMQYVLDRGADINAITHTKVSALWTAANNNNKEVIQFLLDAGIDLKAHGGTALQTAAFNGHLEIVKILIDAGADINYQCFDGHPDLSYTPLHKSAYGFGQFSVVQYLLEAGANTRLKNHYGERAVHIAKRNNKEIAELISKYESADLHDYDLKVEELKRMKLPKGIIQDLGDEREKVELPHSRSVDYLIYCSVFDVTEVTFNGIRLINLLAETDGYSSYGILVWIPSKKALGTYDVEHETLAILHKVTWKAFRKSPGKYIDLILDGEYDPIEIEDID
ncbi:ankyrin repeat domain-containing protein [Paenibacillus paeoniae]|uniref:Ankyrin repeat domain-containing protein n=1 Tax=Paenibacillus paeoniae TaxID=2292705 RepID=A0A371PLD7_9BACL|nr:ankyrin repeat domain-containing protein [Paenibacillus paeoniae]REK76923.1 ankyrin repeat domain-containing protein [Paenibacillus paeoniae]